MGLCRAVCGCTKGASTHKDHVRRPPTNEQRSSNSGLPGQAKGCTGAPQGPEWGQGHPDLPYVATSAAIQGALGHVRTGQHEGHTHTTSDASTTQSNARGGSRRQVCPTRGTLHMLWVRGHLLDRARGHGQTTQQAGAWGEGGCMRGMGATLVVAQGRPSAFADAARALPGSREGPADRVGPPPARGWDAARAGWRGYAGPQQTCARAHGTPQQHTGTQQQHTERHKKLSARALAGCRGTLRCPVTPPRPARARPAGGPRWQRTGAGATQRHHDTPPSAQRQTTQQRHKARGGTRWGAGTAQAAQTPGPNTARHPFLPKKQACAGGVHGYR